MRRIIALAIMLLVAGLYPAATVAGPNGSDNGTTCVQNAQLRPENEPQGSTSTAKGHTQIKVRNDGTIEFKTHINNPDQETFFAGHIHQAPEGVNGPVVQTLFAGPPTSEEQIKHSGEAPNPALGAAICETPENYYVNYHTTANPAGAIRGQLG
jgi:hypothetical protein